MHCDTLWTNARLATMLPSADDALGLVPDGVVAADAGRIVFAGARADAPHGLRPERVVDCDARWITPGLVDCHTHLVHGGHRAGEFAARLEGATYEAIAAAGGGIVSTMRATRSASLDALVQSALPRLDALLAEGVTTIEIKSGYGLDVATELRQLEAAGVLAGLRRVSVVRTLLAAHACPPEWQHDRDGYLQQICSELVPAAASLGLADAVDAFCESIAFSAAEVARVFRAAAAHGLPVKLHADQRSNGGGAALAAEFGALSADHLEHTDLDGVAALKRAGTVAVLLPGAFYFLRETAHPPVAALRAAGVPIAVATDMNPGTSPLTSLLSAMNMAATCFRLTIPECLAGVTRHAAAALGRGSEIGVLAPGRWCDLAIWSIDEPAELVYRMGFNPLWQRVWRGAC